MTPPPPTETALRNLRSVMTQFPQGTVVWNVANAERGVVFGWYVNTSGSALPRVSWGTRTEDHHPFELSRTRVFRDGEKEEWQGGGTETV